MRREPALLAMSLVYLVQGLSDMAWLAEKYFLKDDLGASPAQVSLFLSLASVPWMVKPVLGFISDSLPLWGYRRRSYLLLASVAAAGSWVYLAVGASSLAATLWAMVLGSGAVALSDVVVDSMVVEKAREEEQDSAGNLQSLCWAAYAVGQVATAALSGSLVEAQGPRFVFGLTAAFPLLIGAASLMVHEERVSTEAALRGLTASIEDTWSSDDDEADWEPGAGGGGGGAGWEAAAGAAGGAALAGTSLPVAAVVVAAEAEAEQATQSSGRSAAADWGQAGGGAGSGTGPWAAWSGAAGGRGGYGAAAPTPTQAAVAPLQLEPGGTAAAAAPDPEVAAAAARAQVAAAALFASPPSLPLPPPPPPLPPLPGTTFTTITSPLDSWGPPAAPLPGSPCLGGLAPPAPVDVGAAVTPLALLPEISSASSSSSSSGGGLVLSLLPPPVPAPIPCPTTAALHTTPASPRGRHRRPGGSRTHKPLPSPSALAAATALAPRPHPPSLRERGAALAAAAAAARSSMLSHGSALWTALSAPAIAWPVTFLMLLSATPAADDAVFFFEVEALGFTPSFLGAVQLAIAVASLAGVWLYNAAFKGVPLRSFLLWGNLLGAALQCSDLMLVARVNTWFGLDDRLFVLGGSVVTSVITNVLSMPTLVLAARLCPKGLEATMFATIMSLLNMADGVRYAGGAGLMAALGVSGGSYDNLPLLVGLCNACLLLPLPVLALVPANLDCAELAASAAASTDGGAERRGAGARGQGEEDECELSGLEEEGNQAAAVPVPVVGTQQAAVATGPAALTVQTAPSVSAGGTPAPRAGAAAGVAAAATAAAAAGAEDTSAAAPGSVSGRSRSPHKKPQPHLHPHSHFGDPSQHQPLSEQTWRQGWDPNWPPQPPQQQGQQGEGGVDPAPGADGGGNVNGGNGGGGAAVAADRNGAGPAGVQAAGNGNGTGGAGGTGDKANGQGRADALSGTAAGGGEGEVARVAARGP